MASGFSGKDARRDTSRSRWTCRYPKVQTVSPDLSMLRISEKPNFLVCVSAISRLFHLFIVLLVRRERMVAGELFLKATYNSY